MPAQRSWACVICFNNKARPAELAYLLKQIVNDLLAQAREAGILL